jgi:hypothetical protein
VATTAVSAAVQGIQGAANHATAAPGASASSGAQPGGASAVTAGSGSGPDRSPGPVSSGSHPGDHHQRGGGRSGQ